MTSPAKSTKPVELRDEPEIGDAITCDAFLDGRLEIRQPKSGPRSGIDAVFLAAAVPAIEGRGEAALEAGTGCGVVALALAHRVGDLHVTGIELQGQLCRLAKQNADLNDLTQRVVIVESDMGAPHDRLEELGVVRESFHHVAANPPYHTEGSGRKPLHQAKTRAHMAKAGALDHWIRFLTAMAVPHGSLTLIHRADALAQLLEQLDGRFGAITVFPLFPHARKPASRIIVQGIKGSRAPLKISSGLVLHDDEGHYTGEAEAVLREGRALMIAP